MAMPAEPAAAAAATRAPATPSGAQAMAASRSVASRRRSKGAFGYVAFIIDPPRSAFARAFGQPTMTTAQGLSGQLTDALLSRGVQAPAGSSPERDIPSHVRARRLSLLAHARADLDPGL